MTKLANVKDFDKRKIAYVQWGSSVYRVRLLWVDEEEQEVYLETYTTTQRDFYGRGEITVLRFGYTANGEIPRIYLLSEDDPALDEMRKYIQDLNDRRREIFY